MRQITRVIIEQIYNLKIDEHLIFEDENLQNMYNQVLYNEPKQIYDFMERLFYGNETKEDVKRNVKIRTYREDSLYHQ